MRQPRLTACLGLMVPHTRPRISMSWCGAFSLRWRGVEARRHVDCAAALTERGSSARRPWHVGPPRA